MNHELATSSPAARGWRPLTVWLVLVLATGATWLVGELSGGSAHGHIGVAPILFVLVLAAVKGSLVILDFMELRHAPALWRWVVTGWLLLVTATILLAYLKGTS